MCEIVTISRKEYDSLIKKESELKKMGKHHSIIISRSFIKSKVIFTDDEASKHLANELKDKIDCINSLKGELNQSQHINDSIKDVIYKNEIEIIELEKEISSLNDCLKSIENKIKSMSIWQFLKWRKNINQ